MTFIGMRGHLAVNRCRNRPPTGWTGCLVRRLLDKTSSKLRVRGRLAGIRCRRCYCTSAAVRRRSLGFDYGLLERDFVGTPVREAHLTLAVRVIRVVGSFLFLLGRHGNDTRLNAASVYLLPRLGNPKMSILV